MEERGLDARSGRVASTDLLDAAGLKSEGEDASPRSRYSSCGESEFERYCSANSAMGTPSLCSSVQYTDCLDSEFGSFRSFGDDSSLDSFSLGGRSERSSARNLRVRFSNWGEASSNDGIKVSVSESGSIKEGALNDCRPSRLNSDDEMVMSGKEDEEGGEGEISKDERSEDEDSMYNGSDDDSGKNLPYLRNIGHDGGGKDDGNPFLMNSSTAFGADDWDDFVQETGRFGEDPLGLDQLREPREMTVETRGDPMGFPSEGWAESSNAGKTEEGKYLQDFPLGTEQVLDPDEESRSREPCSTSLKGSRQPAETTGMEPQVQVADESEEYLNSCSITNIFETDREPAVEKGHLELEEGPGITEISKEADHACTNLEKLIGVDHAQPVEDIELGGIDVELDQLMDSSANQLSFRTILPLEIKADFSDDELQNPPKLTAVETDQTRHSVDFHLYKDVYEGQTTLSKAENVELSEFLDDVLHDMEEVLLESTESPGARFSLGKRNSLSESTLSRRDGGLTASTSAADDVDTFVKQKGRIDGVEVIGAKQKKGDVSLSERLLGVKEYTVYVMKVWCGNDQWEVERRYRDFLTLHRRLKSFFAEQGWSLPYEWSSVDRESRKLFGSASPDVISERSALIQDCLRSVIHSRFFSHLPNALLWFLSPQDADSVPSSPEHNRTLARQPTSVSEGAETENISNLGKTIPLILEIRPYKSTKQLLEAQHYCCAGCRKHFDEGKTLVQDFVQTLGWGKPRLCEYMGQLFCSSCHTNETAVLPARVLHYWDFTEYPVCQLAKSYLDSIQDKPMLCVSAVNPFLFAKVPGLLHVMGIRKKIGSMLPFVRCPFRRSINLGLGCRRYLLESNDFFSLRDLIDLSKGAFAALPAMLETVSAKILEHITERCLVCCDVGIPCSAKQDCRDPSSLIFPFQEDEIERCTVCKLVFHRQCFKKLGKCPCQAQLEAHEPSTGALDSPIRRSRSGLTAGLLSTLFPKVNSDRTKDRREDDTIILMGSLPSTTF